MPDDVPSLYFKVPELELLMAPVPVFQLFHLAFEYGLTPPYRFTLINLLLSVGGGGGGGGGVTTLPVSTQSINPFR
jgi:hypothetical protein